MLKRLATDNAEYLKQQHLMGELMEFVLLSLSKCVKGHLGMALTYPSKFALILSEDR